VRSYPTSVPLQYKVLVQYTNLQSQWNKVWLSGPVAYGGSVTLSKSMLAPGIVSKITIVRCAH